MRLWHLTLMILVVAVILAIARDLMGRVILVMMLIGLGMVFLATTATMYLFQTVGAFGEARGLPEHAKALGATVAVLIGAAMGTVGVIFVGGTLLQALVR